MIVTIKARSPGRWSVYRSEGLVHNVEAGKIVRSQSLGAIKTYFFDNEDNRHELGSLPKAWPNQIKSVLRSIND